MFQARSEGYCPSCGRYIGAVDVCPYCGARVRARISLKAIMIFALLTSTIGISALYYAAHGAKPPVVYIKDISEKMNYAHVKIIGYVVTSASYDEQSRRLYFRIMDANATYNEKYKTDTIPVYAYAPVSDELVERGLLPVSGDYIEVVGTLRVRDTISMIINYADDVEIVRQEPVNVTLKELSIGWHEYLKKAIRVTGWVTSYRDYGDFIVSSIRDYSYPDFELSLYIPQPARELTGNLTDFFVGDKITVVGNLWIYRGEPEIVPWSANCVVVEERLEAYTIADILANKDQYAQERRIVKVNATVSDYYERGWVKLYLSDNSTNETLMVFIPSSTWEYVPDETKAALLHIGTRVLLLGVCQLYETQFELYIPDSEWILEVEVPE